MAQKTSSPRGRPRNYDPDLALARATELFWKKGFAATSLEELGEAMGMNRPSIHAAFGDKASLFIKALRRYEDDGAKALRSALGPGRPLRVALYEVFEMLLQRFLADESGPSGCLLFSVAATEHQDPIIRDIVAGATCALDGAFAARFTVARESGELAASVDPDQLALLASGLVHSLSVRARAGDTREQLQKVVEAFVPVILGPGA